jgi:hypothetical protein
MEIYSCYIDYNYYEHCSTVSFSDLTDGTALHWRLTSRTHWRRLTSATDWCRPTPTADGRGLANSALFCLLYITLGRFGRKSGLPTVGCYANKTCYPTVGCMATNSTWVVSVSLPTVKESRVCMGVFNLPWPSNDCLQSNTSQYGLWGF